MENTIAYREEGGVAFLSLNAPQTRNAMTDEMARELLQAFRRAEREARAIVIGAEGPAFCAGANLANIDTESPDRDTGARLEAIFNPLIASIARSDLCVVTAVRGAAAGFGCALALSGDVIIAGDGAYFYQAFRHVGLVPDGGASYLLARAVGRVRAMQMMLLGEKLPAARALEWGLITRTVADAEVDATAAAIARDFASGPRSLALIKQQSWAALDSGLDEQLTRERRNQKIAGRSADFVEGVSAFLGKRKPNFTGQ